MRPFTPSQQNIVDWLVLHRESPELTFRAFLNEVFFNHIKGFSLIIQPKDEFCVFFMPVTQYNDTQIRNENISALTEFVQFLSRLNQEGLITFYSRDMMPAKLYYLGDRFTDPKILRDRIELDDDGLHSSEPSSISDKTGKLIYRGVKLTNNNYHLIYDNLVGDLAVSKSIEKWASVHTKEPHVAKRVLQKYGGKILATVLLVAMIASTQIAHKNHSDRVVNKLNELKSAVKSKSLAPENPSVSIEPSPSTTKADDSDIETSSVEKVSIQPKTSHRPAPKGSTDNADQPVNSEQLPARLTGPAKGIDVSHWDENLIESSNALEGLEFVYIKATEGKTFVDPQFEQNWSFLKGHSARRGAYHFFIPGLDPKLQADHFIDTVGTFHENDLAPVIDVERASSLSGEVIDKQQFEADLYKMVRRLMMRTGRRPMIYSGYYFANEHLTNSYWSNLPLWIADYNGGDKPRLPKPWKDKGHTIWQKSDNYVVDGQKVDLDVYLDFPR